METGQRECMSETCWKQQKTNKDANRGKKIDTLRSSVFDSSRPVDKHSYRVPKWTSTSAFLAFFFDANLFCSPGSTTHTRTESTPSSVVTKMKKYSGTSLKTNVIQTRHCHSHSQICYVPGKLHSSYSEWGLELSFKMCSDI